MKNIVFLSIPTLRPRDLEKLPALKRLLVNGGTAELTPSFPCVTCSVQANLTSGMLPCQHGIVGNGLWHADTKQVEMWTFTNEAVEASQLWDLLYHHPDNPRCAVWFPLQAVECSAEFVCTHKPIHNPDGTETLWCWTRYPELYRELREKFGDFPLHHYWGPMANLSSGEWVVNTAKYVAKREMPEFFYLYLAYPDYQPQRFGPDSPQVEVMLGELNQLLDDLITHFTEAYDRKITWFIAGEYAMTDVRHVTFPNRVLRDAGLLAVKDDGKGGEVPDMEKSRAFAMCDHQFAHVYVPDGDAAVVRKVAELFEGKEGIDEVLAADGMMRYGLNHSRSGNLVLVSTPDSWMPYYWWMDDAKAPFFARTVDIHRKPGYDPCEMFFDLATRSVPLDPMRIRGSHGAPARDASQKTLFLCSDARYVPDVGIHDFDVYELIMQAARG
ncbi:MAG: alkaline phosphatase family protein [Planctomycetia bacterium]|nr:alkaline phosphatase family protein [Planctomycetia bacterium]